MRRTPAVAELFYPAQPQALETEVARLLSSRQEPQPVKAVVSPLAHAREHWVAMQLPFVQMLGEACGIVPLVLDFVPYEVYQQQEMSAAIWIR